MSHDVMENLKDAIRIGDIDGVKKAIDQGARADMLYISILRELENTEVLQLLIENGLNIHSEKNKIVTEWMGASSAGGWRNSRPPKHHILDFISSYYLEKPDLLEKFSTLGDKTLLFRIGLEHNNFNMMKFAISIGANKNEALNSALHRYYEKNNGSKAKELDYEIIGYLLDSNIQFEKITIANGVFFKYMDLLGALKNPSDLEYGYEMAYRYKSDDICEYFNQRGVSKEVQNFLKMKISSIQGDIKELQQAINSGAKIEMLDEAILVEVINKNHLESLKFLNDKGIFFDSRFNQYLNEAMVQHRAYESITFLVEQGLDITMIKTIPSEYKTKYPIMSDMWEKQFQDICEYTIYLATKVYPKLVGKEKDELLQTVAELSSLPYVVKISKGKSCER